MEEIIRILGYILLWTATEVGRKKESRTKLMSSNWWLICLLIASGVYIIQNVDKWF